MLKTLSRHLPNLLGALAFLLATPALTNPLEAVHISEGEAGSRIVKLTFGEPLQGLPMHFTTSQPHRIVLDFPDTENKLGRVSENGGGVIQTYNIVQAGERTRVVLNLSASAAYDLRQNRNVLLVVVRGETTMPGPALATKAAPAAVAGRQIRDINFRRGPNGDSLIEVALSAAGVAADVRMQGQTLLVDFFDTSLPNALQRRLDVSEFGTPAQTIDAIQRDQNTRLTIAPKGEWEHFAYQAGQKFVIEMRPLAGQAGRGQTPRYSGERLSLNFFEEDVNALLKVIADFTNLNIVASDSVKGKITLRLIDVPWDQALDIILRARGLDKRAEGNVIWIAPREELTRSRKTGNGGAAVGRGFR